MTKQAHPDATTVSNAGVLIRFAAMSYDALLVIGLWFIVGVIFVAANGGEHADTHNPFLPSALFIVTFWFNTHFWRRGGQTLGMRAWRLRLLNTNNGPLTLTQCLLRFLVSLASLGCFAFGYLWLLIDKDKLTWHDRYSETRVIREPKA
ncbi:RDD family protein [Oceaniserpentilla sp. 4NH20-0058]|uniref:RDD family protein n=1 Tax=Oceaniserpentilla sp. 4NH20-0058 TaxID=3127660 RepID=UPI003108FA1C